LSDRHGWIARFNATMAQSPAQDRRCKVRRTDGFGSSIFGRKEPLGRRREPTIFVSAPAVLNAIFDATAQRIRQFPLKNHALNSLRYPAVCLRSKS